MLPLRDQKNTIIKRHNLNQKKDIDFQGFTMKKSSVSSTVFIIDDDRAIRDSLICLFTSVNQTVLAFETATHFLQSYQAHWEGCLLIDVCLPDLSGFTLQTKLKELNCYLPIIFMTGHGDIPMAVQALQTGALHFIQKPFRSQELLDHVREALNHYKNQDNHIKKNKKILNKINTLTDREYQILLALVSGSANKEIAINHHLSQRTVETHRSRIMKKMESNSFANLVTQYLTVKSNIERTSRQTK